MKIYKKLALVLAITVLAVSLCALPAFAGSDGNIYIEPNNFTLKPGDTTVVDFYTDSTYTANMASAFEWAFDIGSFYIEQEGDSDFVVYIDNDYGYIRVVAMEQIEMNANESLFSVRITALDDARTITRTLNNYKCDVFDDMFEAADFTADDIVITISDEDESEPTEEPSATEEPEATDSPTATPSSSSSSSSASDFTTSATSTPTVAPTATPAATATAEPTATPALTQVFEDVPEDYWAYDYIMELYNAGVVNGVSETEFMPESNVTRAEFTKMAAGVFGLSAGDNESVFTDVTSDDWYYDCVIAAYEIGMITGTSDTEFSPDDDVTREQMATIIGRYLKLTSDTEPTFADADEIEDYAKPYVAALAEASLITGQTDTTFAPKACATRAESATLIDRVMNVLESAETE